MANGRRKEWHVHGDGRPYSLARTEKRAYLYASDVLAVIGPAGSSGKYPQAMLEALASTMASYLGPRLLKLKHLNHGASLKALEAIARDSAKLAARIESLAQDYLLAIEDNRFEPGDAPEVEKFDMRTLCRKLKRLSHATDRTRATLQPDKRGAPSAEELDVAIERLLAILAEAQLPVATTESGSRAVRRQVSGAGGELLLALFRAFDRHTSIAQIWGAIDRVRSRPTEAMSGDGQRHSA